jgi:hypothetical protein
MTTSLLRSSFATSSANLGLVPFGVKQNKKAQDGGSSKVNELEAVLRAQVVNQKEQFASPDAGQQLAGSNPRKRILSDSLYLGKDAMYKKYSNHLADYANISKQMDGLSDSALRALELSTLESKKELYKLQQTNSDLSMVASQFGLETASDRQFRRRKKINRMSGQTSL